MCSPVKEGCWAVQSIISVGPCAPQSKNDVEMYNLASVLDRVFPSQRMMLRCTIYHQCWTMCFLVKEWCWDVQSSISVAPCAPQSKNDVELYNTVKEWCWAAHLTSVSARVLPSQRLTLRCTSSISVRQCAPQSDVCHDHCHANILPSTGQENIAQPKTDKRFSFLSHFSSFFAI